MIVTAVMDDIGRQLDTISGLRVLPYEADEVQLPAALVSLPTKINFSSTYSQGMNEIAIIVTILVAQMGTNDRIRRDQIAPYGNGVGPKSIRQVLETGIYSAFDVITVLTGAFTIVRIAKIDYLGFTATCQVIGSGRH